MAHEAEGTALDELPVGHRAREGRELATQPDDPPAMSTAPPAMSARPATAPMARARPAQAGPAKPVATTATKQMA